MQYLRWQRPRARQRLRSHHLGRRAGGLLRATTPGSGAAIGQLGVVRLASSREPDRALIRWQAAVGVDLGEESRLQAIGGGLASRCAHDHRVVQGVEAVASDAGTHGALGVGQAVLSVLVAHAVSVRGAWRYYDPMKRAKVSDVGREVRSCST
jgi:hypothetical protein